MVTHETFLQEVLIFKELYLSARKNYWLQLACTKTLSQLQLFFWNILYSQKQLRLSNEHSG
jgi:hypothetical protein